MPKASIYFPSEMLDDIDRTAEKTGVARSEFVQLAVGEHIRAQAHKRKTAKRKKAMLDSAESIRELAEEMKLPAEVADIVRELRDAPRRNG